MFERLSAASLSSVLFPNGRNRVAVRKSDTWQRCFHSTIQDFRISSGFNKAVTMTMTVTVTLAVKMTVTMTMSDTDTDSDNGSESDSDIDCDSETNSELH
jgi:hypothetical protein